MNPTSKREHTGGTTAADSSAVCILGFPRSGTSLVARLCNLLGVDLGPEADLLPQANADNPHGYWEPLWVNDLNDELLDQLGGTWWKPLYAEEGWERRPELAEVADRARRLINDRLAGAPLWGWKDPRTALTLPFWRELVPTARYVLCVRNPVDAIASLQRRPEPTQPIDEWGQLWLEYLGRSLRETADRPLHVVFYEDLFERPDQTLDSLATFLGVGPGDHVRLRAAVEPDLRHHITTPVQLAGIPGIPAEARALFFMLRAGQVEEARQLGPELWWANRLRSEKSRLEQARAVSAEPSGLFLKRLRRAAPR
jgi:hypothetical protein